MSSLNFPLAVLEVLFKLGKAKKFHLAGLKKTHIDGQVYQWKQFYPVEY